MCPFFLVFDEYLGNALGNTFQYLAHDKQDTRAKKVIGWIPILDSLPLRRTSTSLIEFGDELSISLLSFFSD